MSTYFGIPPLAEIEEFKRRYDLVVVTQEEALSHSVIFLRESGFPVHVIKRFEQGFSTGCAKTRQNCAKTAENADFSADFAENAMWRSESALAFGRFPGWSDYLSAMQSGTVIRLFDFFGDKAALLRGEISQNAAKAVQIRTLSFFKVGFSVLVPHLFHVKQLQEVKNSLMTASVGGMIEDYDCNIDKLLPFCDFVFVGANDLLRLDPSENRAFERVCEAAAACRRHKKRITVCGRLGQSPEFRAKLKKEACFT